MSHEWRWIVWCPWLEAETFARVLGDQHFCNACGAVNHRII